MFDKKIFEGFGQRMENMLQTFPIYQLSQTKDARFSRFNMVELGFATLLYLLETMLSPKKRATPDDLTLFLRQTVKDVYNISYSQDEADALRKYLVDTKLRNGGNKFRIPYTNFETGESKQLLIDLIEYDDYSIKLAKDNKVYLKLSDQGVEVLFKTKEMYQEMQITITMLYFKQQLEKNNYSEALMSVNDLSLQIQQQINHFKNKAEKIKTNVLSEFNYDKLKQELESSRDRTEREKEQLSGLKLQVTSVKEKYQLQRLTKKHQKKMNQIEEIDRKLRDCMVQHERLYINKQDMLGNLKDALEVMMQNIFVKKLHFEREILDNWYENQMNQDKLSALLVPMMPIKKKKMYNPMEALSPQKMRNKREGSVEEIQEPDRETILKEEEKDEKRKLEQERIDVMLLEVIVYPLLEKESYILSDALNVLKQENLELLSRIQSELSDRFFKLCVKLHRSEYKTFESVSEDELFAASDIAKLLAKITNRNLEFEEVGSFEMVVMDGKMVEFPTGESITNFKIIRKASDDIAI